MLLRHSSLREYPIPDAFIPLTIPFIVVFLESVKLFVFDVQVVGLFVVLHVMVTCVSFSTVIGPSDPLTLISTVGDIVVGGGGSGDGGVAGGGVGGGAVGGGGGGDG